MSFRNRLIAFFVVLVILPLIVVAAVGFVLASESEQSKTEGRLLEAQRASSGLFGEFRDRAQAAARVIGQDAQLSAAIRSGKRARIQRRLDTLASDAQATRTTMILADAGRFETGGGDVVAPARTRLIDAEGGGAGTLAVSVITAKDYAALLQRVTGADVVIRGPAGLRSTTLRGAGAERLPVTGEVSVGGRKLRVSGFDGPAFGGGRLAVRLLAGAETRGLSNSALVVLAILLAALIAAF